MDKKIDLFVVGTQKSGTTSLINYLGEHPDLLVHSQQEMSFFFSDEEHARGYEKAFEQYYAHGHAKKPHARRLVAKHAAQCHNEIAIERLHQHNPACELVIILRNPVDRAYSSYLMERKNGSEATGFDPLIREIVQTPTHRRYRTYLGYGMYQNEVDKVLKHFERQRLTIVLFEDLKADPVGVSQRIFERLGVDASFRPSTKIHNEGGSARSVLFAKVLQRHVLDNASPFKKAARRVLSPHYAARLGRLLRGLNKAKKQDAPMSPTTRQFLIDFYKPYNDKLGSFLGVDLSAWNR